MVVTNFWNSLETRADCPALVDERGLLSYAELARRADEWTSNARRLGPACVDRPLTLIEMSTEREAIVAYLGCLRARWPVIATTPGRADEDELVSTFRPNLLLRRGSQGWTTLAGAADPAPGHPELALCLSTSGTTGSSKLVRLSRRNLAANAASISEYLALSSDEVAITTLPLHYSYGLSVLHAHLFVGGRVALTEASLADSSFWEVARATGTTSLALVPTQFELLEKMGFSEEWLPRLRYLTQAGGRLDPLIARRFARRAQERGWRLYIMYGQTEAAPRIAYVPPEDAAAFHDAIGRPIPGGRLSLVDPEGRPIEQAGVTGELVYSGPNVMLGYARTREQLGSPEGPSDLRTGDLAERLPNGYFRITGRASRFIKLFGLRIGLDEVEAALRADGVRMHASGTDDCLVAFVTDGSDLDDVRRQIALRYGLPDSAVAAAALSEPPLLPNGKVDYRGLSRMAAEIADAAPRPADQAADLIDFLRNALRRRDIDRARSFSEIGGDSLAYLEVDMFLAERFGEAPAGWERMPVGVLAAAMEAASPGRRRMRSVGLDALWRVAAIIAVIGLHAQLLPHGGGSFLLLLLTGYSLARFQSSNLFSGRVGTVLIASLFPVLAGYYAIMAPMSVHFPNFDPAWVLLTANLAPAPQPRFLGPYWYVSTYAQVLSCVALAFVFPAVRRLVGRAPLAVGATVALGLTAIVAATELGEVAYWKRHHHPLAAGALAAVGWCLVYAEDSRRKLVATLVLGGVLLIGWRDSDPGVLAFLIAGPLTILWRPRIVLPDVVVKAVLSVGALTLYVYLAHVPILYAARPHLDSAVALFSVVLCASLAMAYFMKRLLDAVMNVEWRRLRAPRPNPGST